jgi:TonB-linked SusC/RagA family outer membrane protein
VNVIRRAPILTALALVLAWAWPGTALAQSGTITGVVTNKTTGEPMSGVQVFIEGRNLGKISEQDGRFTITGVPVGTHVVTARFLGFSDVTQRNVAVAAGQSATVDLQLEATVLSLQEITASASTDPISGVKSPFSIGKVSTQNLQAVPAANDPISSIQGKIAGVTIVRSSGMPGQDVNDVTAGIVLRTPTSISGTVTPLYVVDGVILAREMANSMMDIESSEIESIEVIKGAAAASLYGSRAAAGVISITTNRGRQLNLDQTRLRFRTEIGRTSVGTYENRARAHPYKLTADGTAYADENGNPVTYSSGDREIDDDRVMDNPWPGQTFDNVSAILRPGLFTTQQADLAYNGASSNFLVSVNRRVERGTLVNNDGFERANLRVNLDHRLRDDFSFSISAFHSRSTSDQLATGRGSTFFTILTYPPTVDLAKKDADGKYIQLPDSSVTIQNPLWEQDSREATDHSSRTLLSGDARYNPFNWLSFVGSISYDRSDQFDEFYEAKGTLTDVDDEDGDPSDGELEYGTRLTDAINANLTMTATRNFGDLTARVTGRALMERSKSRNFSASGENFWVRDVPDLSVAADQSVSSGLTEIRANGFSIATGFDYAGKYIADVLVRRDGSSLFGSNERWQTYGRVAVAYRMAQESWWPFETFTEFKPRYAVGTAGGRPGFTSQYQTWGVSGNTGAVSKGTLGNPDLKPEFTVEQEMGLDMILANKYQIELTYAKQRTTNNIISMTTAGLTGYGNQFRNEGAIEGSTYEATFQAQIVNQQNFSWNTTLVWDRSRSRITEWNRACIGASNTLGEVCAGRTRGQMLGYSFLHTLDDLPDYMQSRREEFQVNDDGYVVWVGQGNEFTEGFDKDLWGTSTSSFAPDYPVPVQWGYPLLRQNDRGFLDSKTEIGDSNADFQLGWLNNFNLRGLAIHTQFHAQIGGDTYNNTKANLYGQFRHADVDQTGKPDGLRKPLDYYDGGIYNSSTHFVNEAFVESSTYLKMRALAVQYRFNRDQLSKIGVGRYASALSLGVNARDIFTITNYTGMDPEVGGAFFKVDQWYYPPGRTFTFTAEITF